MAISERLKRAKLTSVWLIVQLRDHGIVTDKSELSSILSGTRNGPKVEALVEMAGRILDEYESVFERGQ